MLIFKPKFGPAYGVGVAVGGAGVAVGGTGVAVGLGVAVGGTGVAVGGTGVAVGGTGVAVGGTGVATGGTSVGTGAATSTSSEELDPSPHEARVNNVIAKPARTIPRMLIIRTPFRKTREASYVQFICYATRQIRQVFYLIRRIIANLGQAPT